MSDTFMNTLLICIGNSIVELKGILYYILMTLEGL